MCLKLSNTFKSFLHFKNVLLYTLTKKPWYREFNSYVSRHFLFSNTRLYSLISNNGLDLAIFIRRLNTWNSSVLPFPLIMKSWNSVLFILLSARYFIHWGIRHSLLKSIVAYSVGDSFALFWWRISCSLFLKQLLSWLTTLINRTWKTYKGNGGLTSLHSSLSGPSFKISFLLNRKKCTPSARLFGFFYFFSSLSFHASCGSEGFLLCRTCSKLGSDNELFFFFFFLLSIVVRWQKKRWLWFILK